MFEFAHVAPETATTLDRMAVTAERAGFSSVVVRNHNAVPERFEASADIDVFSGVEVRADSVDQMHGLVGKYRQSGLDFVCVHGGDPAVNTAAANADNVDVLCHPQRGRGRSFNHVVVRDAAENDVAVEFNLGPVLRSSGGRRVGWLQETRTLMKLVRKYDAPFVISGDPYSHLDVRTPRELRALCELIGFTRDESEEGLGGTPRRIAENDDDIRVIE